MAGLQAGWSRRDITPRPGIHMGGYWGRRSGATSIHDPLYARLVAWSDDRGAAVLISLDLIALTPQRVQQIRGGVHAAFPDTVPQAIMVCCTHTHAGPLTIPFRGMGDVDEGYLDQVCAAVDECAAEAAASLSEAQLGYARATVQIGINRRQVRSGDIVIGENPEGPVAPHAHVVTLDTARGRAILFQHACHPVVLGNANHDISADFPGPACAAVEAATSAFAMYVNGAAGDINPRHATSTFDDVERLGNALGNAVVSAAATAQPLASTGMAWGSVRLALPLLDAPSVVRASSVACLRGLQWLQAVLRSPRDEWARRVPRAYLQWSLACLQAACGARTAATRPFEIQGLRIGELTWLGLEGEIFVRYQLDVEAAHTEPVILCGFANGCIGYVPTADEYERGGYEVDIAYKVYPSTLMIAPESDRLIRQGIVDLLRILAQPYTVTEP